LGSIKDAKPGQRLEQEPRPEVDAEDDHELQVVGDEECLEAVQRSSG
jgi:hypothetical protein